MLGINSLVGGTVQLKYQSNIKTNTVPDADAIKPAAKPAAKSAVDAVSLAPKADTKPVDIFAGSFVQIFNNFDTDGNGLVTRDEITKTLQNAGASDKDIEAFADNILSRAYDTNGDGLSLTELNRRLKVDAGDAFAAYDLNSDGQITSSELDEAIDIFTKAGWKIDPKHVREVFADADLDNSKILTQSEFDNYGKYGKASAESRAFEVLFHKFDSDGDGRVTRDELLKALSEDGADKKGLEALLGNIFNATTDVDGDGAISISELRRRIQGDNGDAFAIADLNNNNSITAEELENAIALYTKNGSKFDADFARKVFKDADADGDGVLTRAEYVAYSNNISDIQVAAKPAAPAPTEPVAQKPASDATQVAKADIVFKSEVPKIAPAQIDAQLLLLLQDNA